MAPVFFCNARGYNRIHLNERRLHLETVGCHRRVRVTLGYIEPFTPTQVWQLQILPSVSLQGAFVQPCSLCSAFFVSLCPSVQTGCIVCATPEGLSCCLPPMKEGYVKISLRHVWENMTFTSHKHIDKRVWQSLTQRELERKEALRVFSGRSKQRRMKSAVLGSVSRLLLG